jgi:hypothetical protein
MTDDMRLYECDVDAAKYWIAAAQVFAASVILRKTLLDEGTPEGEISSISVCRIGERRAQKLTFRDDETNTTRTMW